MIKQTNFVSCEIMISHYQVICLILEQNGAPVALECLSGVYQG